MERLKQYRHEKNMDGLAEAEKSLKKYPNNFDIVYNSAALYRAFGIEKKDERLLKRALELYENSRLLVLQNTDFNINESILCGHIAEVLLSLGAVDKAVDMLKKHNAGGIYNDLIGMTMASEDRYIEKAMPYLSDALLEHVVALIRTGIGYFNLFCHQKAYGAAKEIILWGIQMISGLKMREKSATLIRWNVCFSHVFQVHSYCQEKAIRHTNRCLGLKSWRLNLMIILRMI